MNIKRINAAFIFIIMLFTISAASLNAYAFRTEISDTVEDLQFQKNNTEKYYLGETIKAGDDDG